MFYLVKKRKGLTVGGCLIFIFVCFFLYSAVAQDTSTIPPLSEEEAEKMKGSLDDFLPGADESQRFLYEPEGRRDPFISLLRGRGVGEGMRPAGIEGMNISEIVLIGILDWGDKGRIALFKGTDNKTYQRKVGQAVFDGGVFAIDKNQVTFKQKVYDVFGNEKPSKMIPVKLHPKKEEGL